MAGKHKPEGKTLENNAKKERSAAPELPGVGTKVIDAIIIAHNIITSIHSLKKESPPISMPKPFNTKKQMEVFAKFSKKLNINKVIKEGKLLAICFMHIELCITVLSVLFSVLLGLVSILSFAPILITM